MDQGRHRGRYTATATARQIDSDIAGPGSDSRTVADSDTASLTRIQGDFHLVPDT